MDLLEYSICNIASLRGKYALYLQITFDNLIMIFNFSFVHPLFNLCDSQCPVHLFTKVGFF